MRLTTVCPTSLALLRRPRLRCFLTLMKSSRNPTIDMPTRRKSTRSADREGRSHVTNLADAADHHRDHDGGAAHRGGASLQVMRRWAVFADQLPKAPGGKLHDRPASDEQRQDERARAAQQDGLQPGVRTYRVRSFHQDRHGLGGSPGAEPTRDHIHGRASNPSTRVCASSFAPARLPPGNGCLFHRRGRPCP